MNNDALRRISANPLIQKLTVALSSPRGGPWLVGGAVRDLLLGVRPRGFDFLSGADVMATAASLSDELGCPLRFVDTNFVQVLLQRQDGNLSFARLSSGETLEDNLLRRDFTVNSLALSLPSLYDGGPLSVIDVSNGMKDLNDGILRPQTWTTILDEPLAFLRGLRLSLNGKLAFVSTVRGQICSRKVRELQSSDKEFWEEFIGFVRHGDVPSLIERAEVLSEYSASNTLFRIFSGTFRFQDAVLDAFKKAASPLSWARREQHQTILSIVSQYIAEILTFLLITPDLFQRGRFVAPGILSGNELAGKLSESGCCEKTYLANMEAIYEALLSLGNGQFPLKLTANQQFVSSSGAESDWPGKVAAIILFASFSGCCQDEASDLLVMAKARLSELVFD